MINNPPSLRSAIILLLALQLGLVACSKQDGENSINSSTQLAAAKDFQRLGQYQAAIIETKKVLQKQPTNLNAQTLLTKLYLEIGQNRQAIAYLNSTDLADTKLQLLLAQAFLFAGKVRSSEEALDKYFTEEQDDAAIPLLRGKLQVARAHYDLAGEFFELARGLDPTNIEVALEIAMLELVREDYPNARTQLEVLGTAYPNNTDVLITMAKLERQTDNLALAESLLTQVISLLPRTDLPTPTRYRALNELRDILFRQGRLEEARIYAGIIREQLPTAVATEEDLQLAIDLLQQGKFNDAREELKQITDRAPGSKPANTMLAMVDFLAGDHAAAAARLEGFIDAETSDANTLQIFAVSELKLGQPQSVIDRLKADIDDIQDGRILALYGIAMTNSGRLRQSESYFLRAIELDPDFGRLYLPLAKLYVDLGRLEEAKIELQKAIDRSPSDATIQRALVSYYLRTSNLELASKFVKRLEADYPDSPQTQLIVANYYLTAGEFDQAKDSLDKVLALGPSKTAQHQLAAINLKRSRYSDAIASYQQLIEQDPDDAKAHRGLMTAYERSGLKDDGLRALEALANKGTSLTPALVLSEFHGRNGNLELSALWLGKAEGSSSNTKLRLTEALTLSKARKLMNAGKSTEGIQLIRSTLEQYPTSSRLLAAMTTIYIADNNLVGAAETLSALKDVSQEAFVYLLDGDLHIAEQDFQAARSAYGQAWLTAPDDQLGFKLLATLKSGESTDNEITAFLEDWQTKLPNSRVRRMSNAGYLYSSQKLEAAQREYEKLLVIEPENVIALNNLAWIYGETNLDEALRLSNHAYQLAPGLPAILDTHGWFLFQSGAEEAGTALLEEAARLSPNDKSINQHLQQIQAIK
jgi:putative PEP-CTERM system TPR-repeat lipoprotein